MDEIGTDPEQAGETPALPGEMSARHPFVAGDA
jgi:hypothetical protein